MNISKILPNTSIQISLPNLHFSKELVYREIAKTCFLTASYFTDPLCKGHEFFRRLQIVEVLHPMASRITNFARKAFLLVGLAGFASVALVTTPMGIGLRYVGLQTQPTPFIYLQGDKKDKTLPLDQSFSLLSWNVCCIGAGYPISDGGVTLGI